MLSWPDTPKGDPVPSGWVMPASPYHVNVPEPPAVTNAMSPWHTVSPAAHSGSWKTTSCTTTMALVSRQPSALVATTWYWPPAVTWSEGPLVPLGRQMKSSSPSPVACSCRVSPAHSPTVPAGLTATLTGAYGTTKIGRAHV